MDKKELSLEEIQKGSFAVLLKFKELCEKLNLRYWLCYGTLIGAIRHHGFIPWDDDVDVSMPREDYEKFIDYCIGHQEELKPLEIFHYRSNKKFIYPIARLSDSRYTIDYSIAKDYGLGLFIDIYPLDEADNNNKALQRVRKRYIKRIYFAGTKKTDPKRDIKTPLRLAYYFYTRFINLNKTLRKYNEMFINHKFGEGNYGCFILDSSLRPIKKEHYAESIDWEFNGVSFKIPKEYDYILTATYGDYMKLPPEEDRVAHHYYHAYKK